MDNIIAYQKFLEGKNNLTEKIVNGVINFPEYLAGIEELNIKILNYIKEIQE